MNIKNLEGFIAFGAENYQSTRFINCLKNVELILTMAEKVHASFPNMGYTQGEEMGFRDVNRKLSACIPMALERLEGGKRILDATTTVLLGKVASQFWEHGDDSYDWVSSIVIMPGMPALVLEDADSNLAIGVEDAA